MLRPSEKAQMRRIEKVVSKRDSQEELKQLRQLVQEQNTQIAQLAAMLKVAMTLWVIETLNNNI